MHKEATELLTTNRALRQEIFWHEVVQRRIEKPCERVIDPWMVTMETAIQYLDLEDAPALLDALRGRPLLDDKLIALSRLVLLWARSNRPVDLMKKIQLAVGDSDELKSALKAHLAPPPPEREAAQRRMTEFEQRSRDEEAERAKQRQVGIEYLKANVSTLNIGDHAKDGRVLTNINYLHSEIAQKSKNSSRWSVAGSRPGLGANHSCLEDQDRKNMLETGVVYAPARSRLVDTPPARYHAAKTQSRPGQRVLDAAQHYPAIPVPSAPMPGRSNAWENSARCACSHGVHPAVWFFGVLRRYSLQQGALVPRSCRPSAALVRRQPSA